MPDTGIERNFAHVRLWGPQPTYPKVLAAIPASLATKNGDLLIVAGPCSVESPEQINDIAKNLSLWGVTYLRGGIFRAGTYPNPARGFGFIKESVIAEFARAAHDYGMKVVLEVLDIAPEAMALYDKYGDAYQVGARQMQNYSLLRLLARRKRPVFLKRHPGATIDEFLGAAEWLLQDNKADVVLVERGSATHAEHVRWDLSISMIPAVRALTRLPILVDASHGTGRRDLVEPMTLAGLAAGADGFMIEVHPDPNRSLTDADQAYPLSKFAHLAIRARAIRNVVRKVD